MGLNDGRLTALLMGEIGRSAAPIALAIVNASVVFSLIAKFHQLLHVN